MPRPAFAIFARQYLSALLNDMGTVYLNTPVPRDPQLRVYKMPSRSNWGTQVLDAVTAGTEGIIVSPEVIGEAELVDVLFEPDPDRDRAALGLLGELLFVPCIIESLRWTPSEQEMRTCMSHWFRWQVEADGGIVPVDEIYVYEEEDDNDEENEDDKEVSIDKILLVILPSIESHHLSYWGAKPSPRNIPGVYELAPAFCTTIVVTSELPQDNSTLWLRLLGRGRTQRSAIEELMSGDGDRLLRKVALEQLQQWYRLLVGSQMGTESNHLMQLLSRIEI